jgi:hypothetical protein
MTCKSYGNLKNLQSTWLRLARDMNKKLYVSLILCRPRRRWEDNIRMDLREIGFGDVDWIYLAQDRDGWRALVNTVMNLRVP